MKTCRYKKTETGYGWLEKETARCCIIAVATGHPVIHPASTAKCDLKTDLSSNEIKAIKRFDRRRGTTNDLHTLNKLADRLKISMEGN